MSRSLVWNYLLQIHSFIPFNRGIDVSNLLKFEKGLRGCGGWEYRVKSLILVNPTALSNLRNALGMVKQLSSMFYCWLSTEEREDN